MEKKSVRCNYNSYLTHDDEFLQSRSCLKIPLLHVKLELHKATITSVDMNWCCIPRSRTKKQENPYSNSIGGKENVSASLHAARFTALVC